MLPLLLMLGGCAQDTHHPLGRSVTRTRVEPDVYQVKDDDRLVDQATRHARATVRRFIMALGHPAPGQHDFAVKKLFISRGDAEHIWLKDIHYEGGRFYGSVDNQPEKIKSIRVGERESVNPDEISDWLYIENGHLVGGYTLRVLADELSPEQKAEFEKEAKFTIGR